MFALIDLKNSFFLASVPTSVDATSVDAGGGGGNGLAVVALLLWLPVGVCWVGVGGALWGSGACGGACGGAC